MTRMAGLDYAVRCNIINTHSLSHTHTNTLVEKGTAVANNSRCAVSQRSPWPARALLRDGMSWDERGGGLTREPVGPFEDTATMTTLTRKIGVDPGMFSSRCCAFRHTPTSADPIRLLHTRLALCLTVSLPSRFALSARLMIGVLPQALWPAGAFLCGCTFWNDNGGRLSRQPVGPLVDTSTIITVTNTNRMDSGSFSSPCCTFRRTHTSADPIRLLLCIRLALPLALSLLS